MSVLIKVDIIEIGFLFSCHIGRKVIEEIAMDISKDRDVFESWSVFSDNRCVIGEGALWRANENAFYWLDLEKGIVYRKTNDAFSQTDCFELNIGKIGAIVETRSDDFLLFAQSGIVWRWIPNSNPTEFARLPEAKQARFNDVVVTPDGKVCCTVAPTAERRIGSAWIFDSSKNFTLVDSDLRGMPNGMGFSVDGKFMYLTVSDERVIYKFDYYDGFPKNKTAFAKLPEDVEGVPDGMAVDVLGNIWSANWNGYSISKYSPTGEEIDRFNFPIKKVTSVAFGGNNLDEVLVTTANFPWAEEDYENFGSGKTLKLSIKVKGAPRFLANF